MKVRSVVLDEVADSQTDR